MARVQTLHIKWIFCRRNAKMNLEVVCRLFGWNQQESVAPLCLNLSQICKINWFTCSVLVCSFYVVILFNSNFEGSFISNIAENFVYCHFFQEFEGTERNVRITVVFLLFEFHVKILWKTTIKFNHIFYPF